MQCSVQRKPKVDFGKSTDARVLTRYLAVRSDETKAVCSFALPV